MMHEPKENTWYLITLFSVSWQTFYIWTWNESFITFFFFFLFFSLGVISCWTSVKLLLLDPTSKKNLFFFSRIGAFLAVNLFKLKLITVRPRFCFVLFCSLVYCSSGSNKTISMRNGSQVWEKTDYIIRIWNSDCISY